MDIIFADTALACLRDIFEFYLPQTGLAKAYQIIDDILKPIENLEVFPLAGKTELIINGIVYRSVNTKRHKYVYRIADDSVFVMLIWDNRQDPRRLRRIIHNL